MLKPRILVNEPGYTVSGQTLAGQVYLLDLSLNQAGSNPNRWASPLFNPHGAQKDEIFGAGIAVGDFDSNAPGFEIAISARARDVTDQSHVDPGAGEVYVFKP